MTIIETAVILAAGTNRRLENSSETPKCLLNVAGESLISRSIRILQRFRIRRIVIVVGFEHQQIQEHCRQIDGLEFVQNQRFQSTETLVSLDHALRFLSEPFLLLEGDLFYAENLIRELLKSPFDDDAILVSDRTFAGDEVWVQHDKNFVSCLSKNIPSCPDLDNVSGLSEFVGISKITQSSIKTISEFIKSLSSRKLAEANYDEDGLTFLCRNKQVYSVSVPGESWGEIDTRAHFRRVVEQVVPFVSEYEEAHQHLFSADHLHE